MLLHITRRTTYRHNPLKNVVRNCPSDDLRTRFIVSKLFTNKLNTLQSRMFQLIHSNSSLSIKHNISQLSTFHCSVLSFHSDDEVMCGWWKTLKAI